MYVYEWDKHGINAGVIARMEVRNAYRGSKEAVLFAHPHTSPTQLHAVRKVFHDLGLSVTPAEVNGRPALKVRGFKKRDFLVQALEANAVQPLHSVRVSKEKEKNPPQGFAAKVKANSLKLSGYIWMIGDWALILSGLRRGDVNEALSGLGYGSTSVVAALWGERKTEQLCDDMYHTLVKDLATEGYRLPHGSEATLRQFGKKGRMLSRVEQFLYTYPAQVIAAVNAVGGYHMYRAGRSQNNMDKVFAGLLVCAGMLVGLLVPEKRTKEPQTDLQVAADSRVSLTLPETSSPAGVKGTLQKAWDFVRERPLRIGGYLSMANNLLMLKGAVREQGLYTPRHDVLHAAAQGKWHEARDVLHSRAMGKITPKERQELADMLETQDSMRVETALHKHQKSKGTWHFNFVAAASYLLGNWLFSLSSSRGAADGGGKKDAHTPLYDMAAMFILQQPEPLRDTVLDKITSAMVKQKGLDMEPEALKTQIMNQLQQVGKNPWFQQSSTPQHGAFEGAGFSR